MRACFARGTRVKLVSQQTDMGNFCPGGGEGGGGFEHSPTPSSPLMPGLGQPAEHKPLCGRKGRYEMTL
jgi:hypothetical protein